ncbi:MAG TPA: ester cyclase [Candidatus Margulisiibacteriota bacterium]|nr:ester cyclase [Candidatus Margulisiibacteriota bacterium]
MDELKSNRQLIQEQWDAFNRGDMVGAAEFFAQDTHNHGQPVGRAGVLAVLKDIQGTFPDVRFEALRYVCEGEWVSVRGMFSGTHRGVSRIPFSNGVLVGVEPTERRFEVQHIHLMRIRDGKIVEHWANRDDVGMMQQLGLMTMSAAPAGK